MESAPSRSEETTCDHWSKLPLPDDGFDPLVEIRRLRHDLMLRLQQLQQSLVEEDNRPTDVVAPLSSTVNETILYVTPVYRESDAVSITPPNPTECETTVKPTATICEKAVSVEKSVAMVPEESSESPFTQVLGWTNKILIAIGAAAAVAGIYHHIPRKQLANPQQLAMTLLLTGTAMVVIGVVGWWLHRRTRLQFTEKVGCRPPGGNVRYSASTSW